MSLLTSDANVAYRPRPYEMALVPYYKALNYAWLGQPDEAVVEARSASQLLAQYVDASLGAVREQDRGELERVRNDAFLLWFSGMLYEAGRRTQRRLHRLPQRGRGLRAECRTAGPGGAAGPGRRPGADGRPAGLQGRAGAGSAGLPVGVRGGRRHDAGPGGPARRCALGAGQRGTGAAGRDRLRAAAGAGPLRFPRFQGGRPRGPRPLGLVALRRIRLRPGPGLGWRRRVLGLDCRARAARRGAPALQRRARQRGHDRTATHWGRGRPISGARRACPSTPRSRPSSSGPSCAA